MPVVGLPPAVETVMAQMLEQNILSSWKITGGKKYATVSLHFIVSMADQAEGGSHIENRQYRSKPPSAITRDKRRISKWKSMQNGQKCEESGNVLCMDTKPDRKSNIETSEGTGVMVSHISVQTEDMLPEPGLHNAGGQSLHSNDLYSSDPISNQNITTNTPKQQDILSISSGTPSDTQNSDSEVFTDINRMPNTDEHSLDLPLCECCQTEVKRDSWWRCTRCICDICDDCIRRGEHISHCNQLCKFIPPTNSDSFCDGCGFEFKTRQA